MVLVASAPQIPFTAHQIPSNRDHKALNEGTLEGLGVEANLGLKVSAIGFHCRLQALPGKPSRPTA